MARLPRCDLAGIAQHVIQRGNDRQACFATDNDYLQYRRELAEAARRFGCAVHAYVLMTNHVHILVTPAEAGAVSHMMQAIGRRYVACFNARYRRTGTLWEGRFKASLVDSERYVLTCYRYIELNPVRAGMVPEPAAYRWSSHACNGHGASDAGLVPHPSYVALGNADTDRREAYRALFARELGATDLENIRAHTQQQRALGSARFRAQMEALVGRNLEVRPGGRPRPQAADDGENK